MNAPFLSGWLNIETRFCILLVGTPPLRYRGFVAYKYTIEGFAPTLGGSSRQPRSRLQPRL